MKRKRKRLKYHRRRKKQQIVFRVDTENGVVRKIHNSHIYQPIICFKGGSVKWYDDIERNSNS